MKRILSVLYTLATVLIIVGALFIIQNEAYGVSILIGGIGLNIVYRMLTLSWGDLSKFRLIVLLRLFNILLMSFACVLFLVDSVQKFNFLILTILFDLVINFREISFKSKK